MELADAGLQTAWLTGLQSASKQIHCWPPQMPSTMASLAAVGSVTTNRGSATIARCGLGLV